MRSVALRHRRSSCGDHYIRGYINVTVVECNLLSSVSVVTNAVNDQQRQRKSYATKTTTQRYYENYRQQSDRAAFSNRYISTQLWWQRQRATNVATIVANNSNCYASKSFRQKSFKQPHSSNSLVRSYSSYLDDFDPLNNDIDFDPTPSLSSTTTDDVVDDFEVKYTTMDASIKEQLYENARRLLYSLKVLQSHESNRPEILTEIDFCLRNLANARTIESVDLSIALLDSLIQCVGGGDFLNTPLPSDNNYYYVENRTEVEMILSKVLTNWDLWYSLLVNWHQVSKQSLDEARATLPAHKIISPRDLLLKLDKWKVTINNVIEKHDKDQVGYVPESELFDCTNSKTLSLLIDILARQGRHMTNQSSMTPIEIEPQAEFAESLLIRMMEQSDLAIARSENNFPPSTSNLNMVIMLWARTSAADRAYRLLQYATSTQDIRPDLRSYNAVIHAYAKSGDGTSAERVLYDLLLQQQLVHDQQESERGDIETTDTIQPDIISWNSVLAAWARFPDKVKSAERVEQLLSTMVTYSNGGRLVPNSKHTVKVEIVGDNRVTKSLSVLRQSVKPDLMTLNTSLSAWARVGEAETCARLLGEMRELHKAGQLQDPPDIFSYATVMNAFAKTKQAEKAEALWDGMYQAYLQGAQELKPTLQVMSTVLDAYSRQIFDAVSKKNHEAAFNGLARAEKIFERIRELFRIGHLDSGPDTLAYNIMLKCYLYCGRAHAIPKSSDTSALIANDLLLEMKKLHESKQMNAAPSFATYSIVIQAWLTRRDGTARAIELLDEVWQKRLTGDPRMRPDVNSITSIISGFCQAQQPKVAQKFLLSICEVRRRDKLSMIEPKIEHFGLVFTSLQRSKDPDIASYAQNLYDQMKEFHKLRVIREGPDNLICQTVIGIWVNSKMHGSAKKAYDVFTEMKRLAAEGDKSMEPDLKTYHQILFSLSGDDPEPIMAENIVRQLYADYKSNNSNVKPTNKTFNYALTAWSRFDHPESISRADAFFKEMQKLHAMGDITCDVITFNIMLHCLALSSKREAAERAEKLLFRMIELADAGHETFRPTAVSYGCLISAWVRVLDLPRAESILLNMYREWQSGKEHLKPQVRHFEQVSRAWLSTNDKDKNSRSRSVLILMNLVYPSVNKVQ